MGLGRTLLSHTRRALARFGSTVWLHTWRGLRWDLRRMRVTPRESAALLRRGIDQELAQHYLAWRRSLLLVLALVTLSGAVLNAPDNVKWWYLYSPFGITLDCIQIASTLALPASALLGALVWTRPRLSRGVVFAGWAASLLVPMLLALFPVHWSIDFNRFDNTDLRQAAESLADGFGVGADRVRSAEEGIRHGVEYVVDVLGAAMYAFALLPALLALIPGTLQASIRTKLFLPESVVPGWFLVALSPFYLLLLFIALVVCLQLRLDPLVRFSLLALMAAPFLYLTRAGLFVHPLPADGAGRVLRVQLACSLLVALSFTLMITFLMTKKLHILGIALRLVGFDPSSSLASPRDVLQYFLDYYGRTWFTMAVLTDFFVRIHLSTWQHVHRLAAGPAGGTYHESAAKLRQALSR
jgi:hypothetical protein